MTTLRDGLRDFVGRVVAGSPSLAARADDARAILDAMTEGWGDRPASGPPHVSYLSRDGTPFEPSVRIARGTPSELRWVMEVQPADASPRAEDYFAAARALDDRLAARGLVELSAVRRIEDIFRARYPDTTAALWFGMALGPSGPPQIKNYFVCSEPSQWRTAFARFGLDALAAELAATLSASPSKIEFVSIDLAHPAAPVAPIAPAGGAHDPRLKLYVRHRGLDPRAIDAAHASSPTYVAGDAERLVKALFGDVPPVKKLGPISTFHISLARGAITHSSINVPLEPLHYAREVPSDDAVIALNIARFIRSLGLPIDPLYAHMLACALDDGVRYPHHRYVGLQRRGDGAAEVTVYMSTFLQARRHGFAYGPVRLGPAPLSPPRPRRGA